MRRAQYSAYRLIFKHPATTSRETMTYKDTFFVRLYDSELPDVVGVGECALFRGLSADDVPDYEERLSQACRQYELTGELPTEQLSSMRFGFETALADLKNGGVGRPYPSPWSEGRGCITINGLVWMGTIEEMTARVEQKLDEGFRCVKFKVGGQDFDRELSLIKAVRERFAPDALEIRLDANGAFTPDNAMERLISLAPLHIHSIEQPIRQRQWSQMAQLCKDSPIPISLDEELIGIVDPQERLHMLQQIRPQYIILKPSLCGGISGATQWIHLAQSLGIGWWVTSALESNVGLNALAQWVSTLDVTMPQGLGTGNLYVNNLPSHLHQQGERLSYRP